MSFPCSDKLWETVLEYFKALNEAKLKLKTDSSSAVAALSWRHTNKNKAECQHCVVAGGGPLVKCSVERCRREYHMECGFKSGAFFLEENENGNVDGLTFLCEVHYKPILFCTCLQPYDLNKSGSDMICCDECNDWFHINCVGLSKAAAEAIEDFTCPRCTQLLKENKAVSLQEKERNLKKDKKSTSLQNAGKSIRILVDMSESIAPFLDVLQPSQDVNSETYSLTQLKEAESYLESHDILSLYFKTIHTNDQFTIQGDVNLFGTASLLYDWFSQIKHTVAKISEIISDFRLAAKKMKQIQKSNDSKETDTNNMEIVVSAHERKLKEFPPLLPAEIKPDITIKVIAEFLKSLKNDWLIDLAEISAGIVEVLALRTYLECYEEFWKTFQQYLQILQGDNGTRSWLKQLDNQSKLLSLQFRKVQQFAEQEPHHGLKTSFGYLLSVSMEYVKLVNRLTEDITEWSSFTANILNNELDADTVTYKDDVENLIQQASGLLLILQNIK
jgi:hypothetical protein